MALSSIRVEINNNPSKGYVEIHSTKIDDMPDDVAYLLISRRIHGSNNNYEEIYEKVITNDSQLTFQDIDITARSGYSYDYYVRLTDGNTSGYTTIEFKTISNIECWFDGLFIGNDSAQYFAPLECNTDVTRNNDVNYVMTLSGRTPYRVSNSNANYSTGSSSGLFTPIGEDGQPVYLNNNQYTNEVVDFLADGTEKILKTYNGDIWYVTIDQSISIPSNDGYTGYNIINFNWTEIGDVPLIKKVTE